MESSAPESSSAGMKRKRASSSAEEGRSSAPPAPLLQGVAPGIITSINYLVLVKSERLRLIEGDNDTFGDILATIDGYQGVLNRHESLASNMGAKLVGPLLIKSFDKLFDGPIKVIQTSLDIEHSSISWLDVISFARTNPGEFLLSEQAGGTRSCRFPIKGGQVEISEDDYRLIISGAPERMIPLEPLAEDETAELATINILESRLSMLIRKADAVASKARQFNYHLKQRKSALMARKATEQPSGLDPENHPQPFSAVNARSSQPPNGEAAQLQAQLLEEYLSLDRRDSISQIRPKAIRQSDGGANVQDSGPRRMSHPLTSSDDGSQGPYRALMLSKIEKLNKGDTISPPCDRCRRLKFNCTKRLTACNACTIKHAKCTWMNVTEEELNNLPQPSIATAPSQTIARGNSYTAADLALFAPGRSAHPGRISNPSSTITNKKAEDYANLSEEQSILAQIAKAAAKGGQ